MNKKQDYINTDNVTLLVSISNFKKDLSNKTIKDKVLSYCSLLVNHTGSTTITIPMSYTSLAQYLCVDRSALMRELKRLSDKNILKVNKRVVTVTSLEYI